MIFSIIIPGEPVPKARARVTRWGAYTPQKTLDFENFVKFHAAEAWGDRPPINSDLPLLLVVQFYLPRPKSTPKRIKRPIRKPDFDNLVKSITDALEGIVYPGDQQIVSATIDKYFSDRPRTEIEIYAVDDDSDCYKMVQTAA